MSDKLVRIKNRYDTYENWNSANPVLAAGEIGIDSTHNHIKIGDGSSMWNDILPVNSQPITYIYFNYNDYLDPPVSNGDGTYTINIHDTQLSKGLYSISTNSTSYYLEVLPFIGGYETHSHSRYDIDRFSDNSTDPYHTIEIFAYDALDANIEYPGLAALLSIYLDKSHPNIYTAQPTNGLSMTKFIISSEEILNNLFKIYTDYCRPKVPMSFVFFTIPKTV